MGRGSLTRAIHDPAEPEGFEQYALVLMRRGDNWNPATTKAADVMKLHDPFIKQMIDQGNLAIVGRSHPAIRASCGESPFFGW